MKKFQLLTILEPLRCACDEPLSGYPHSGLAFRESRENPPADGTEIANESGKTGVIFRGDLPYIAVFQFGWCSNRGLCAARFGFTQSS